MHEIRSTLVRGERRQPLARKTSAAPATGGGSLTAIRIRREEARRSDQRREGRQLNVVDTATIYWRGGSREVPVLNLSSQGAMIECDLAPRIGARIEIQFADCNRTRCFVRWVRDGRIGLEFDEQTLVIAPRSANGVAIGGRRAGEQPTVAVRKSRLPRHALILRGELHSPTGSMPVRLRNISIEGAMLEASCDLRPETAVVLELPGVVAAPARVRWCRSRQIGIRFDETFDLSALSCAGEAAEPQSPAMLKPDYLRSETDPESPWAARWERLSPDDL